MPAARLVLRVFLCLGLAVCARALPHAAAHSPEAACAAFADGDDATAARWLTTWLEGARADAAGLPQAARLARDLRSESLLLTVRALGEEWERDGGSADLDLALGWAYLGLAETRMAAGNTSSSLALILADAQTRAERQVQTAAGSLLLAEKRATEGDIDGAIQALESARERLGAGPELCLQEGRLRYRRGAAWAASEPGTLRDGTGAELDLAIELLAVALDDEARGPIGRARRDGHLHRAWAAHRLGHVEDATADYLGAYAVATREGGLALRGLASLHARSPQTLVRLYLELRGSSEPDVELQRALARAQLSAGEPAAALAIASELAERRPDDPAGWLFLGEIARAAGQRDGARTAFVRALRIDPRDAGASGALEALAQEWVETDPLAAVATYEELLALRPQDPFIRNNYGFVLRELISPFTDLLEDARQVLKVDASPAVRLWLQRSVQVYLEAVQLIAEDEDGQREIQDDWNLAGIVNDAGLMLHYFVDVADLVRAEALYHRALRMTDSSFKDTYIPNLRRLYSTLLMDREWVWHAIARKAKDAILMEAIGENGVQELVADEAKRAQARQDEAALRTRMLNALKDQAHEDGRPWPPGATDK